MRKSTVRIGEAIYSILKSFKKVYPLIADEDTTFPFIIYRRSSGFSQSDKDGIYSALTTIDVTVAALEYDESVELADKIINQMESTVGNVAGFDIWQIRMVDSNEVYVEKAFVQELRFQVEFSTSDINKDKDNHNHNHNHNH